MDELLSLFGADGTEDEHSQAKREGEPSKCNDFGSSFDRMPNASNRKKEKMINTTTTANKMSSNQSKENTYAKIKTAEAPKQNHYDGISCDPITGLRIVERKTSRGVMIVAFSLLTYRSCSILAASSRAEWNNYIIDGGGGSNKTNLVTW